MLRIAGLCNMPAQCCQASQPSGQQTNVGHVYSNGYQTKSSSQLCLSHTIIVASLDVRQHGSSTLQLLQQWYVDALVVPALSPYICCSCRAGYIFLFLVFLLLIVHYQRTARAGLKHLHYSMFRVASMTIRLQTRLRLWAILCMIITTLLLWYLGIGTCTTNLQVSWLLQLGH